MKINITLLLLLVTTFVSIHAQEKSMMALRNGKIVYGQSTAEIDSIIFSDAQSEKMNIYNGNKIVYHVPALAIDSISFTDKTISNVSTEIPLTANMLSTNAQESSEGDISNLVDRNTETFFHSKWSTTMALPHWFNIALTDPITYDAISFRFKNRHNKDNDGPVTMKIYGSTDGVNYELLETINDINAILRGEEYSSQLISLIEFETKHDVKPQYLRFSVHSTHSGNLWFSMAEFWLYGHEFKLLEHSGEGLAENVKVAIKSASASTYQSGASIGKSIDGNYSTNYHSSWSGNLPVTLIYNFTNVSSITHFIYYPRQDGGKNGIFKKIEVKANTKTQSDIVLGTYEMPGTSAACRINLPIELIDPKSITIKVTESAGGSISENNRYASCAEMEFYGKDTENVFYYSSYFTDITCSELKQGVTQADINNIEQPLFKQLATDLLTGNFDTEFRVQSYDSYQHPDISAKILKTSTYGLRDNPTGIYTAADEEIIVLAGDLHGQNVSVFIQNPNEGIKGVSFPLGKGINRFTAPFAGLMYVYYYTKTGEEAPVKLNIVTGSINGYFDNSKHNANDWSRLLNMAQFHHFDLKGQYASMTFETNAFKSVPDGKALIDLYDKLVYDQQEFMGLIKYNKQYKNRAHFQVVYGNHHMYASSYHTGYHSNTQSTILNVDKLTGKNMSYSEHVWGPAHELGHVHQTRPGLKWIGLAEVTNNIHSAYIQSLWTGKCRLMEEKLSSGYANRYEKAFEQILDAKVPYIENDDVFCRLVPFWQLKLYLIDVLEITDFYKDLYELVRNNPDLDNGASQLKFVEFACEAANLDLTHFFERWGFLTPLNITVSDYSTTQHVVTQEMIDETKARIAAKNYPTPPKYFTKITENNKHTYK